MVRKVLMLHLVTILLKAELTQEQVAEKFDCSQQYVDKIKKDLLQKINLLFGTNNQPVPEDLVELAEFKPFLYGIRKLSKHLQTTLIKNCH